MIPTTDKAKIAVAHLKCPKCGQTLVYKASDRGDYYCCPDCAGYNFALTTIISQMAQYIDRLEKSGNSNLQN